MARWSTPVKEYEGIGVTVRGLDELLASLEKLNHPNADKMLQDATKAAGTSLKKDVQAEMPPARLPGDGRSYPGALRRSASVRKARWQRPATLVTNRRSVAYWWPMVIGGSRPHRIRFPDQKAAGVTRSDLKNGQRGKGNIKHPGHRGNDFLSRALARGGDKATAAAAKVLGDYLDSI